MMCRPRPPFASKLSSERSSVSRINSITGAGDWRSLNRVTDDLGGLSSAVDRLPDVFYNLVDIVARIERATEAMGDSAPPVIQVDDRQRWLYFKVGVGLGVAAVLIVVWLIYKAKTG